MTTEYSRFYWHWSVQALKVIENEIADRITQLNEICGSDEDYLNDLADEIYELQRIQTCILTGTTMSDSDYEWISDLTLTKEILT
jgi:hypothetical protein